jgi:hypothetical protein
MTVETQVGVIGRAYEGQGSLAYVRSLEEGQRLLGG